MKQSGNSSSKPSHLDPGQTVAGHPFHLSAAQPARLWTEAWPLGNGRLGAMVFGGHPIDRIALNEETLYAGHARPQGQPDVKGRLGHLLDLLRRGEFEEADREVSRHLLGRGQECYQPLGDLIFEFSGAEEFSSYHRTLEMDRGLVRVEMMDRDGDLHEREYFTSAVHNIFAARIRTSGRRRLNFRVRLSSVHPHGTMRAGSELSITGHLPSLCLRRTWEWIEAHGDQQKYPEVYDEAGLLRPGAQPVAYDLTGFPQGMEFHARLNIRLQGEGRVEQGNGLLEIADATDVVIVLAAASSYAGFNVLPGRDAREAVALLLDSVRDSAFEEILAAHEREQRRLFGGVQLCLSSPEPCRENVADWRSDASCELRLTEALFHFGRYLLIASSHPSCLHPANLQGIWNEELIPPWASAYTTNINLEMNYWPTGPANLLECNEPLFRLIEECAQNGRITAEKSYGLPGWVLHHNTDAWRKTDPVDNIARTAYWPMASGWLCCHLWEHFLFSSDEDFLRRRAYPLMKGACEFYLGWLVQDAEGRLVTPLSTSPENGFVTADGQTGSVSLGATMDLSILRALFTATGNAARICGEPWFSETLKAATDRLLPFKIGRHGQLQEWAVDWDRPEDHHRHVSHLFGVYPGSQISAKTPELQQAALRSLELRGSGGTGWSQAWKAAIFARLGKPEKARQCLVALLLPAERDQGDANLGGDGDTNVGGVYPNLLAACPPFQIDANFGFTAAVCEMLLQSHTEVIRLLPALPAAWREGRVEGLLARGGVAVSIEWRDGKMTRAKIRSHNTTTRKFSYQGLMCFRTLGVGVEHTLVAEDFS